MVDKQFTSFFHSYTDIVSQKQCRTKNLKTKNSYIFILTLMIQRFEGKTVLNIRNFGTLPCCALGAQITTTPLIFDFPFFLLLILAHVGGSNPAGPKLNLFPNPAAQT